MTLVKEYSQWKCLKIDRIKFLITFLWGVRKRSWKRKTAVRETDKWTDTRTHLTNGRTNKQTDKWKMCY